jgi:nucleoside-diphosphate-sugar epimerase
MDIVTSVELDLTIAVTGPTGTFGSGLVPQLQADGRVGRIIGIARRPFDPAALGWSKMTYRQGDVRDPAALEAAFRGADVVIHLAFLVMGNASLETIRQINVDGTLNAFRAAAAAGARRFIYASSVAAYGFHRDNPIGMTEDWPVRPAARLFYAKEKAELEHLLHEESAAHPEIDLYLLRPPIVVGPHAVGAKNLLPPSLDALGRRLLGLLGRFPVPLPIPALPLQLIHEDDVGNAILLCSVAAGPPGAYNIAGDGVLSTVDIARELGITTLPIPAGLARSAARMMSALPSLPFTPPATQWIEAASHPAIMDVTKAKRELGWQPHYTALEAFRDTVQLLV